jgi:hypothetical protein
LPPRPSPHRSGTVEANDGHHQSTQRPKDKTHNEADADPKAAKVPPVSDAITEGEELNDREHQPEHETYEAHG